VFASRAAYIKSEEKKKVRCKVLWCYPACDVVTLVQDSRKGKREEISSSTRSKKKSLIGEKERK
jgi:hypothetical protein